VTSELVYVHAGFGVDKVPYLAGWDLQRRLHELRAGDGIPDACLLLEHEPVYTAGRRTSPLDRPAGDAGAPVIDVDRGGRITWHGPGQLVGYPIIRLAEPVDVIAYVRALEEAMIRACAEMGVATTRVAGRSGVWVTGTPGAAAGAGREDRKVGAIGVRVSRGVTMHGFALNCEPDLAWYDRIVPCGIRDAGVTSLSAETGRRVTVADLTGPVERHLAEMLGARTWRRAPDAAALTGSAAGAPLAAALR
jgi:lipoyl(octanoyl) transferase